MGDKPSNLVFLPEPQKRVREGRRAMEGVIFRALRVRSGAVVGGSTVSSPTIPER
jgi:hypothetical protein